MDDSDNRETDGGTARSLSTRKTVRIVGISVERMEPDNKPLYIKIRLDGAKFSKLPSIKPKALPELRKWPFLLNLQDGSQLTVELLREHRVRKDEQLIQLTLSFDKIRSFLDATVQDNPIEYQVHTRPEISLELDSGGIVPQARMGTAVQKSKELLSVLERLGKWQSPLTTLLETSTAISEANPIAKAVLATFNVVYRKLQEQDKYNEQVRDLAEKMASVCRCICDVEQFTRLSQLEAALEDARFLMEKIENLITLWASRGTVDFFVGDSIKRELDRLSKDYAAFQQRFDRGIAVDSAVKIDLLLKLRQSDKLLEELRPKGIESIQLVSECMEGTRETLLSDVDSYLDDLEKPDILWIKGHPGVGKSALASTIVSRLRKRRRPISYFAFKRAEAALTTPNALWRHIASDLAERYPAIAKYVIEELQDKGVLSNPNSEEVFKHLIEQPFMRSMNTLSGYPHVVIIDGLDECGGLEGRRSEHRIALLETLKKWPQLAVKFKLIITSREEKDIFAVLSPISYPIPVLSGTSVTNETSGDIRTFFIHRFRRIAKEYEDSLDDDWPGLAVINTLTTRAAGLFIWAKTAVEYIDDGEPTMRVQEVTDQTHNLGDLGQLYSLVLKTHFSRLKSGELHWFRAFVGTMVLAKRPLARMECIGLLEIKGSMLDLIRNGLRSVMDPGEVLRFAHQSFVDFLFNRGDCPQGFFIDPGKQHYLVNACLRVMSTKLHFNMCELKTSTFLNADVPDMKEKVEGGIQSYLSYSCFHWADHLSSIPFDESIMEKVKETVYDQFLYWLETMSLLDGVDRVIPVLQAILEWSKPANDDTFLRFVEDAKQFVLTFKLPITESAPHIYISALPFAPRQSLVARKFLPKYPRIISITTGKPTYWPPSLFISEHYSRLIIGVTFSRDQRYFAVFGDAVFIYSADTGDPVSGPQRVTMPPFGFPVSSVAFSPDGHRIASAFTDGMVTVQDTKGGKNVFHPPGTEQWSFQISTMMVYSHDGRKLASCEIGGEIRVWDLGSGKAIGGPFKGSYAGKTAAIAFSPDNRHLTLASQGGNVEIWDVNSGTFVSPAQPGARLRDFILSPNGQSMTSFRSRTIHIWDIEAGKIKLSIKLPNGHISNFLAYSADSKFLASVSRGTNGTTVRVWDSSTGKIMLKPLLVRGREDVNSVALSVDGRKVILGFEDGAVGMWNLDDKEAPPLPDATDTSTAAMSGLQGESPPFTGLHHIAFSPDGKKLVSNPTGGIQVWDTSTGASCMKTIRKELVPSAVFSPDGKWIASISRRDRTICLWDAETGQLGNSWKSEPDLPERLAFLPDGGTLVSCSNSALNIWNVETMEQLFQHIPPKSSWFTLSPDGTKMIWSNNEGSQMWSIEAQKLVPTQRNLPEVIRSDKRLSPSGKLLSSRAEGLFEFRVWDAETFEAVGGSITGPLVGAHPSIVAISPDDHFIAVGYSGGTIKIFDVTTNYLIHGPWSGHPGMLGLVFSPDGERMASYSSDGVIRMWNTPVLTRSSPNHSLQEQCDSFMDECIIEDGWVMTPERELLFWVPVSNRKGLWWPRNTAVIVEDPTKLDFTKFEYGENWEKCRGD